MYRMLWTAGWLLLAALTGTEALAQNDHLFVLTPDGKQRPFRGREADVRPIHEGERRAIAPERFSGIAESYVDTLTWRTLSSPTINFGFDTGDTCAMWFKPLAGCWLKAIRLHNQNFEGAVILDVWAANYDGQIRHVDARNDDFKLLIGRWEDGTWVPGYNDDFTEYPLGAKLWGPVPVHWTNSDTMKWVGVPSFIISVDLGRLPFFVTFAAERTGGWGFSTQPRMKLPWHMFKFYASSSQWAVRDFSVWLDVLVEYYEDIPPHISEVELLRTTLSTKPRSVKATIIDRNPTGGPAGLAGAELVFAVNTVDTQRVAMTPIGDGLYEGVIPGGSPGDEITYWVEATDINGNVGVWDLPYTYAIFKPQNPILLLANDRSHFAGMGLEIMVPYYLWGGREYERDEWDATEFGEATTELVDQYAIIIEFGGEGPMYKNWAEVMKPWLDNATPEHPKRYFISQQDYGVASGYEDDVFPPGSLEYDYFGIESLGPKDYNYEERGDQENPTELAGIPGDPISGFVEEFKGDSLKFYYHPTYEIGFDNWIDNIVPNSTGQPMFVDPHRESYVNAVRARGENWQTVFMAFDPLACNFRSDTSVAPHEDPSYHWVIETGNIVVNALRWFDAPTKVGDAAPLVPTGFRLVQSYPNPFGGNGAGAVIEYALPRPGRVRVIIYNTLGQLVRMLVDQEQVAGLHRVRWDGTDEARRMVANGVYFYRMEVGDLNIVRKLAVIR